MFTFAWSKLCCMSPSNTQLAPQSVCSSHDLRLKNPQVQACRWSSGRQLALLSSRKALSQSSLWLQVRNDWLPGTAKSEMASDSLSLLWNPRRPKTSENIRKNHRKILPGSVDLPIFEVLKVQAWELSDSQMTGRWPLANRKLPSLDLQHFNMRNLISTIRNAIALPLDMPLRIGRLNESFCCSAIWIRQR